MSYPTLLVDNGLTSVQRGSWWLQENQPGYNQTHKLTSETAEQMPQCYWRSHQSPVVVWHQGQGKKLCQCWILVGQLSAASALAGLEPHGHRRFAILLLRRVFSPGSVRRTCSSVGPGPVLMLCLHLSQKKHELYGRGWGTSPKLPQQRLRSVVLSRLPDFSHSLTLPER